MPEMAPGYDPDAILADPDAHPKHRAIAAINIRVRDHGEHWAKCCNCGDPYQLTEQWPYPDVCSGRCAAQYVAYLNNPDDW